MSIRNFVLFRKFVRNLFMSRDLISQLKNLKHKDITPSDAWLKQNRGILLSQIKNNAVSNAHTSYENFWIAMSVFFGEKMILNVVKPLSILLIVTMVGTSGWIATVDAAYESLPGDILYGAKRVVEKTQITTASVLGNKDTETKLHSEFAKRRANEIKKVSVSDDPKKTERVVETVKDLKNEMNNLSDKLEGSKQVSLAANTLKEVKKNTDQIKSVLTEVKDDLSLVATSTVDKNTVEVISQAKDMVKDVAVKTVEAVVSKHLEGDVSVSTDEIKKMLNETVTETINETLVKTGNLVGVNNIVEAVKTEIKVLDSASSTAFSTTSSADLAQQIENIASTTKQAALQTQEIIKDSDKKTDELQSMLNSGDLAGVLNMVKEVNEVNKTVEKIIDTAVGSVQLALPPVVSVVKEKTEAGISVTSTADVKVIVTSTPTASTTIIVTTTPVNTSTTVETSTLKK